MGNHPHVRQNEHWLQLLELTAAARQRKFFSRELTLGSGEGDGTPLQYSSLENPMDGGAW